MSASANTATGTGVIVPLLTPINEDESVNFAQLRRLVDHVVEGGVDGLLAMGSTGEFARFDPGTRGNIIAEIVERTAGRVPVYAGVGDTGLRAVLRNMRIAERAGADALAVTLPYYYPVRGDEEAYLFYSGAAKSTALPFMLYNIPGTCGASIGFSVIDRMLAFDNVIGLKDSSGDLDRLLREVRMYCGKARGFTVVIGSEELSFAGLKAGADGVIPSMGNPFPKLFAALYAAAKRGDDARLQELCATVDAFNRINSSRDSWMAPNIWRKRALHHMGICGDRCTMPYLPVDEAADAEVRDAVAAYARMFA